MEDTDPYENINEKSIQERMSIALMEVQEHGKVEGIRRYFRKASGIEASGE